MTTNLLAIILTVVWVLFMIVISIYLMATAANDRRRRAIEAREQLENANRDAISQWLAIYRDKVGRMRIAAASWTAEKEMYERRIGQLQQRIDMAERLDNKRLCQIMELEARIRALGGAES